MRYPIYNGFPSKGIKYKIQSKMCDYGLIYAMFALQFIIQDCIQRLGQIVMGGLWITAWESAAAKTTLSAYTLKLIKREIYLIVN